MENDYKKLLRISQVFNSSLGTNGPGGQHVAGMNVRLDPIDSGIIKARCIMTVTYTSDQMMREMQRRNRNDAIAMIKGAIERAAEDYEARFDEKLGLEMDSDSLEESTEFIHISQYTALSRAFYRVNALIHVK